MSSTLRAMLLGGATTAKRCVAAGDGCRESLQESQASAVDEVDRGEIDDDVRSIRDGTFDLCLQALDIREIDLATEADDDAPILVLGFHQGSWISHVRRPSGQDAEAYHCAGPQSIRG